MKAVKSFQVAPGELLREQAIEEMAKQIVPLQQEKRKIMREPLLDRRQKEQRVKILNRRIDTLASIVLGKPLLQDAQ